MRKIEVVAQYDGRQVDDLHVRNLQDGQLPMLKVDKLHICDIICEKLKAHYEMCMHLSIFNCK